MVITYRDKKTMLRGDFYLKSGIITEFIKLKARIYYSSNKTALIRLTKQKAAKINDITKLNFNPGYYDYKTGYFVCRAARVNIDELKEIFDKLASYERDHENDKKYKGWIIDSYLAENNKNTLTI
jgi:hypothetical protein